MNIHTYTFEQITILIYGFTNNPPCVDKLMMTRIAEVWLTACLLPSDSEAARKIRWLLGNGWVMEPTASPFGPCKRQSHIKNSQDDIPSFDSWSLYLRMFLERPCGFLVVSADFVFCLTFKSFICANRPILDSWACHYANQLREEIEGTQADWVKCLFQ